MIELEIKEIQLVSGGANYGLLLDASLIGFGAYLGSSLAYIEPLMTYRATFGPMGIVAAYTPNTLILISGVILGASIGIALSKGVQGFYHSLETHEFSST